ncbi:SDR family NAD(P)-dependent oxidoreductase [Varunaivibrio sulfuroxidans]|uniref:Short-subunit dehydrogenase n=1 Tax=Varunaivibrio sulfuroxidans TaxID=1773489 RepID=A0A4R3JDX1_9PROT|nr:SDR family NAD(P)-dependent oxidoreductase [Varunaivibrio sulfuroxidans]TCS63393.1 short-subunit dehydrogenase [Varunaivibrio sulfuroxidans]WES30460.1 SDR family NAD(P)-dependent oxidoreductase [Varunaivibrio sulfuroxidans]
MNIDGANIVLTGAGSGIGQAMACELSRRGAYLTLADINAQGLEQTHALLARPEAAAMVVSDVTTAEGRAAIVHAVEARSDILDILINNAGVVAAGPIDTLSDTQIERICRVNIMAPMALSRDCLPLLRRARPGMVANVGSVFGDIAFPLFAAYSASKFAVRGLSDALRRELADDDIFVTYIAPRAAKTAASSTFKHLIEPFRMRLDTPEKVAQGAVRAIARHRRTAYPMGAERFYVCVQRLAPNIIDSALTRQIAAYRRQGPRP